jgi:DNA-binding MarR family transcriptional regulator
MPTHSPATGGLAAGRLWQALRQAEQAAAGPLGLALRAAGLTVTQYGTMLVLADSPGLSGAQLARACLVTPQSMAGVLSRLDARGLVDREPSPVHRTVQVARLSRTGRATLRRTNGLVRPVEARLAGTLSPDEVACLVGYLDRIGGGSEPAGEGTDHR